MLKLTIALVLGFAVVGSAEDESADAMYNKVFGNEIQLSPEQTRDYLVKLVHYYAEHTGTVEYAERWGVLYQLRWVAKMEEEDCKKTAFIAHVVQRLLEVHGSQHKLNIVPYIKHYFKQHIDHCKADIEEEFDEIRAYLDPVFFDRLQRLAQYIKPEIVDGQLQAPKIDEQILEFMDEERRIARPNGWLIRSAIRKLEVKDNFIELVAIPLRKFLRASQNVYYIGLLDDDVVGSINPTIVNFLRKMHLVDKFARLKKRIIAGTQV